MALRGTPRSNASAGPARVGTDGVALGLPGCPAAGSMRAERIHSTSRLRLLYPDPRAISDAPVITSSSSSSVGVQHGSEKRHHDTQMTGYNARYATPIV